MSWNWQAIIEHFPELLKASLTTIELVVISCAIGLVFGVLLGLWRLSPILWLRTLPAAYIFFFSWDTAARADFLDLLWLGSICHF